MKTLTLTQPWAQLVVIGAKKQETRSWRTSYRGDLLIHAAKTFPLKARTLVEREPFSDYVRLDDLLKGYIIGKVTLVDIIPVKEALQRMAGTRDRYNRYKKELAFGDYSKNRWIWIFKDPIKFKYPIQAKGSLNIWEYPVKIEFFTI